MQLGNVKTHLSKSPKFKKDAKEIADVFAIQGINTLNDLDNAPRALGPRVGGHSSYQIVAYLRHAVLDAAVAKNVEPAPEPVVVEVEETEAIAEEQAEKAPEESETISEGVANNG